MTDDLIARLRAFADGNWSTGTVNDICQEAADAIAALSRAKLELAEYLDKVTDLSALEVERAERADAALSSLKREVLALIGADDHATACERTMGATHPCTCGADALRQRLSRAPRAEDIGGGNT